MKFAIEKEFFKQLHELVMSTEKEHCGNLISDEVCFHKLGNITEGGDHSCNLEEEKQDEFFHTHPFSSKSYPSYADIESIVKKRKLSVVATFWGIWFIYKKDNQVDCRDIFDIQYIFNAKYEEYNIYFHSQTTQTKGMAQRSIPYDKNVEELINRFIADMNKTLKKYCTIKFVAWNNVRMDDVQALFSFGSKRGKKKSIMKKSKKSKKSKKVKKSVKKSKKSTRKVAKK